MCYSCPILLFNVHQCLLYILYFIFGWETPFYRSQFRTFLCDSSTVFFRRSLVWNVAPFQHFSVWFVALFQRSSLLFVASYKNDLIIASISIDFCFEFLKSIIDQVCFEFLRICFRVSASKQRRLCTTKCVLFIS